MWSTDLLLSTPSVLLLENKAATQIACATQLKSSFPFDWLLIYVKKCHSPGPLSHMWRLFVIVIRSEALGNMYILYIWVDYPFEGATFPWTIGGTKSSLCARSTCSTCSFQFQRVYANEHKLAAPLEPLSVTHSLRHSGIQINQTCLSSGSLVRLLRRQNPRRTGYVFLYKCKQKSRMRSFCPAAFLAGNPCDSRPRLPFY